jgi:hypothetical protein
MHETWPWHAYRFALGFLWKNRCDIDLTTTSLNNFFTMITAWMVFDQALHGCQVFGSPSYIMGYIAVVSHKRILLCKPTTKTNQEAATHRGICHPTTILWQPSCQPKHHWLQAKRVVSVEVVPLDSPGQGRNVPAAPREVAPMGCQLQSHNFW